MPHRKYGNQQIIVCYSLSLISYVTFIQSVNMTRFAENTIQYYFTGVDLDKDVHALQHPLHLILLLYSELF